MHIPGYYGKAVDFLVESTVFMSRGKVSSLSSATCDHPTLTFVSSPHAAEVGFKNKVRKNESGGPPGTYPAPLVLPGDELSLDPLCPLQSLRSWLRSEDRNEVRTERNVIYVAAPPDVDSNLSFISTWSQPRQYDDVKPITQPSVQEVVGYLAAFFRPLPVKLLPLSQLCFTSWESDGSKSSKAGSKSTQPRFIGLNTSTECVRIRTRASKDGVFSRQLNLDDLLDAAINMVPENGYALLTLVHHDLFESVDDEFVCGRAYGGSRVAVISTARYNPALDLLQNVEREHAWPASHCEAYVRTCCGIALQSSKRPQKRAKARNADLKQPKSQSSLLETAVARSSRPGASEAMPAAVSAHASLPSLDNSPSAAVLSGLWLSRICRTASHELGHCFGIEHCVYYACVMQGSASLMEDSRQPPYLCPIDLSKILQATSADPQERYLNLLAFCSQYRNTHVFSAFAAWIEARLKEINGNI